MQLFYLSEFVLRGLFNISPTTYPHRPYPQTGVMFKKLKQKIEEGGESGIDKVAFSPRKLPGSVVRSSSQTEEPHAASHQAPVTQTSENGQPSPATTAAVQESLSESRDEDQGITVESVTAPTVIRGSEQVGDWVVRMIVYKLIGISPSVGILRSPCS